MFLQAPCDLIPTSVGGRLITCCWWMAVMVVISTYTAKLGSLLIVNQLQERIESIDDLADQEAIDYGNKNAAANKISTAIDTNQQSCSTLNL